MTTQATRMIATLLMTLAPISFLRAQALFDPNLPSAQPKALQQLSDNRIRQKIMQQSQARYGGRCVCPYQTHDLHGRTCKGRHEVIKIDPKPICYPRQVTSEMVNDWRLKHP
jgi:starvation-inducible outer membrane lipoprotein